MSKNEKKTSYSKRTNLLSHINQQKNTNKWFIDMLNKHSNVKTIMFDSNVSKKEFDLILDIIGMLIVPGGLPGYEYIETMYQHNHYLSYAYFYLPLFYEGDLSTEQLTLFI